MYRIPFSFFCMQNNVTLPLNKICFHSNLAKFLVRHNLRHALRRACFVAHSIFLFVRQIGSDCIVCGGAGRYDTHPRSHDHPGGVQPSGKMLSAKRNICIAINIWQVCLNLSSSGWLANRLWQFKIYLQDTQHGNYVFFYTESKSIIIRDLSPNSD